VDDPATPNTGVILLGIPTFLDMGPYEFQTAQPCTNGLVGDLNCDGIVNMLDLILMALNFLETI